MTGISLEELQATAPEAAEAAGSRTPALRISRHGILVTGLVLVDVVALALAAAAAYLVRFYVPLSIFRDVMPRLSYYWPLAVAMIAVWIGLFALGGLYAEHNLLGGTREYALVFNACTIGVLLVVVASFMVESFVVSRGLIVLAWLFTFLTAGGARFLFRRVVYRLRRRGHLLSRAVIVGANAEGIALAEQLDVWAASGMLLAGFVDDTVPPGSRVHNGLRVLGSCDDLDRLIETEGVEELVVATAGVPRERVVEIVRSYGISPGVNIHFSSGLFEILTTGVTVQERAYVPLISLNKVRLTGIDVVFKAGLDLLLAVPGAILISPLLALIALLIKLDSPGPALYRRRVLGLQGRPFDAYKFRTMRTDWAETVDCPQVRDQFVVGAKPRDDPRVTRVGRFLRRYSLDELPQLFNVLRREMSLVGPRMITTEEVGFYDRWSMNLLTIRPGITGLWQVSGRADISYEEKVRLDMYYIRNYSIWLDLQILMRTISVVLKGNGAY